MFEFDPFIQFRFSLVIQLLQQDCYILKLVKIKIKSENDEIFIIKS